MAEEYNQLEKELRHPAAALQKLIFQSAEPTEEEIWSAIKEDIGWSKEDIDSHFAFYSDWHKDIYGVRPHGAMPCPIATVRGMRTRGEASSRYADTSVLRRIDEWEEASERERQAILLKEKKERLADVTLNGEKLDVDAAATLIDRDASWDAVDAEYEKVFADAEAAGGKYEVYNDVVDRLATFPKSEPVVVHGDVA